MSRLPDSQLTHVGLYARDLDRMVDFYSSFFGMVLTDSSDDYHGRRIAFLSRNANEHHQIVLLSGRPGEVAFSPINQISFRVETLECLKHFHAVLVDRKTIIQRTITHGNAWSIYFFDPEDNRIEMYCASPWYVNQPYGVDLDFSDCADVIRAKTEALIIDDPSRQPHEYWSANLKARLERQ